MEERRSQGSTLNFQRHSSDLLLVCIASYLSFYISVFTTIRFHVFHQVTNPKYNDIMVQFSGESGIERFQ